MKIEGRVFSITNFLKEISNKFDRTEKKQEIAEEKIDLNAKNINEVKKIINVQLKEISYELKEQMTKEILKELMNERLEITDNNINSLSNTIPREITQQLEITKQEITKEVKRILNSEVEELKKENLESKKSGDEMQDKLGVILGLIDEVKKSQEINFNNINNQNSLSEENIIVAFKNIYDQNLLQKQHSKEIEEKYQSEIDQLRIKEKELNKYTSAFDTVKGLILTIDNLHSIKDQFYEKFDLVRNDETTNIIKLVLRNKSEILKASLIGLREVKLEKSEEITSLEIEFYSAINNFMESEIVLIDKINDQTINSEYWDVKENTQKFARKIFPPVNAGNNILRGIAKGEY